MCCINILGQTRDETFYLLHNIFAYEWKIFEKKKWHYFKPTLKTLNTFNAGDNNLPRARERFSPPLTRPSAVTLPPAATILSLSGEFSGLWSSDRSMALPARLSTHLESPTLATMIWLFWIKVKIAVQPLSWPGWKMKENTRMNLHVYFSFIGSDYKDNIVSKANLKKYSYFKSIHCTYT